MHTHKHPTLAHNIFMQRPHIKKLESTIGKESPKEFGDALTCVIGSKFYMQHATSYYGNMLQAIMQSYKGYTLYLYKHAINPWFKH